MFPKCWGKCSICGIDGAVLSVEFLFMVWCDIFSGQRFPECRMKVDPEKNWQIQAVNLSSVIIFH